MRVLDYRYAGVNAGDEDLLGHGVRAAWSAASSVPLRGHQPWNYTQHYLLIDPGLVSIDSGRYVFGVESQHHCAVTIQ